MLPRPLLVLRLLQRLLLRLLLRLLRRVLRLLLVRLLPLRLLRGLLPVRVLQLLQRLLLRLLLRLLRRALRLLLVLLLPLRLLRGLLYASPRRTSPFSHHEHCHRCSCTQCWCFVQEGPCLPPSLLLLPPLLLLRRPQCIPPGRSTPFLCNSCCSGCCCGTDWRCFPLKGSSLPSPPPLLLQLL